MERTPSQYHRHLRLASAAMFVLSLAVVAGWMVHSQQATPFARSVVVAQPRSAPEPAEEARRARVTRQPSSAGHAGVSESDDGVVSADPKAPQRPGMHPHPITAEHRRIFRQNELVGALYGAMDLADGAGIREIAEQYRAEFPDDPDQLQDGCDLIADCLESPGPASTAAAEHYDAVRAGSILRRFVRRLCLQR